MELCGGRRLPLQGAPPSGGSSPARLRACPVRSPPVRMVLSGRRSSRFCWRLEAGPGGARAVLPLDSGLRRNSPRRDARAAPAAAALSRDMRLGDKDRNELLGVAGASVYPWNDRPQDLAPRPDWRVPAISASLRSHIQQIMFERLLCARRCRRGVPAVKTSRATAPKLTFRREIQHEN